jgi:hypothetical protein
MITLTGTLTEADHKGHVPLAFDVPMGTTRLRGRFSASPTRATGAFFDNLISLSLFGPDGPRGARHNNDDMTFDLTATTASPGYLPGPIEPGRWTVWLDCFRLLGPDPVAYTMEITCDTGPVEDRAPAAPVRPATRGPGWYRGDLHAHSLHSDASWDIPDLVAWARRRGLDFMTLSDHNTLSGHAELHSLADDALLTIGGTELTTHYGHALSLGGSDWHEWRTGEVTGKTMPELARAVQEAGCLYVIAHPMSPGDPACTGCRWEFEDMRPGPARLVEIWNGGPWSDYNEDGLTLFRQWLGEGHRLLATAGSDIHGPEGGTGPIGFNSVEAAELSEAGILSAVRAGRNYLSSGPRLILTASADGRHVPMGGSVGPQATFHADWQTEAEPLSLIFHDRTGPRARVELPAQGAGVADLSGAAGFVMAELRDSTGRLHAVTNPIFVD